MVYIYGLACPDSGAIRYIGKSENPPKRLRAHISSAVRGAYSHHTARWLKRLVCAGKAPALKILHAVREDEDWREVERQWIAKALSEGWPLTNTTGGGEGLDYLDPEAEAVYRANHRAAMKAWSMTESGKDALRKMRASLASDDVKRRRRDSLLATWSDPVRVKSLSSSIRKAQRRPETMARHRESSKRYWRENKAEQISRMWTPESRAKHKAARIAAWADPEVGAKLRAIHASPEVRAKKSEGAKRRSTPEYRAMMAERTRLSWEKRRNQTGA